MSTRITIHRPEAPAAHPPGPFLVGAAEADITPHLGFPLAGYSTEGEEARGVRGHLFARALYLRDTGGDDVALCIVDMMSASRLLLEMVARLTAPVCGITVDRLVLAGTHTHTGPGWFYGNSLYDHFAAKEPGFDERLCDWLANRIADAVNTAAQAPVEGAVAVGKKDLWGVSRNRSICAFRKNSGAGDWNSAGFPGANPPGNMELNKQQLAVDPRVTGIAAVEAATGRPVAVFGWFGCHSTTLGPDAPYYSSDWPGEAVRHARWKLESEHGAPVVVAMGLSAAGDVNGLRYGLEPKIDPGPELSRWVGERVGQTLFDIAEEAVPRARAENISTWFAEPKVTDPPPASDEDVELAKRWYFGAPTMGGSEESRTVLWKLHLAREGQTSREFDESHPQHPKARGGWILQNLLKKILDLHASDVHPLHGLRIGDQLLVTVPGEPTGWTVMEMRKALQARTGAQDVTIVGYGGDYGGYFTSRAEYGAQHYEGSSMLYGRNASAYVRERLAELTADPPTPAVSGGSVPFETKDDRKRFRMAEDVSGGTDPSPKISREGRMVEVQWRMPEDTHVVFAYGWWVCVERKKADGSWEVLQHMGRDLDDVGHPIGIHRMEDGGLLSGLGDLLGLGSDEETWIATIELPEGLRSTDQLRVRVRSRDQFPGFEVDVP